MEPPSWRQVHWNSIVSVLPPSIFLLIIKFHRLLRYILANLKIFQYTMSKKTRNTQWNFFQIRGACCQDGRLRIFQTFRKMFRKSFKTPATKDMRDWNSFCKKYWDEFTCSTYTVELGYIGFQRTGKFIRYIRGNFYCFVLWGPKILSDISDYPL